MGLYPAKLLFFTRKAKGNLMLREDDAVLPVEDEYKSKFTNRHRTTPPPYYPAAAYNICRNSIRRNTNACCTPKNTTICIGDVMPLSDSSVQ